MRALQTRAVVVLLAAGLLSIAASCPPAGLSPEARRAFHVEQVTDRVIAVQDAAIAAHAAGELPDATALAVVQFTVSSLRTLDQAALGWDAAILTGIAELRAALDPAEYSVIETVLVTLETLVRSTP